MDVKIGHDEGVCLKCGRTLRRRHPADFAVCDCYQYCPNCSLAYTIEMQAYTPDLTPSTYGSIEGENVIGDPESPLKILYRCPKCGYLSIQIPVEVQLS